MTGAKTATIISKAMQDNDKYKVIATKVSPEAYALLGSLAKSKGMKVYELLQLCADTLIRYMSDLHNLTPDMERAMGVFEHMIGWAGALNMADPTTHAHITEATYYMEADGKRGTRAIHVNRPFFGDWQQTENIQTVIERTLELTTPERYRRLRRLAVEMDCHSILELLDVLIDRAAIDDANIAEIRRSFEDNNRAENNRPVEYGQRTKRHNNRVADRSSEPQVIHFAPEDMPDLPELND